MLSGAGNQNGEKTTMGLVQEGGATLLFSNYVYSLMLNLTKRLETKISELHARATLLAEAFPLCFSALYCHSLRGFGCSRFVLVVNQQRKRPLPTAACDSC